MTSAVANRAADRVRRRRPASFGMTALFVVIAIPYLYPFLFLIGTALKSTTAFLQSETSFPSHPTFENLSQAWTTGGLNTGVLRSLEAVGVSIVVTTVVSSLAGFWFLRHTGRIANAIRFGLLGTLAIPGAVFIIPLFVMFSDLNLTGNLVMLGVVYGTGNARFGTYLMHDFYKSIPGEILEAARVDGASLWKQFVTLIVPISRPALATLTALSFVWAWGDLLTALVLASDPSDHTATVAIATLVGQYNTGTTLQAAGVMIALLPMLAVFVFAQRFLTRGAMSGAVK